MIDQSNTPSQPLSDKEILKRAASLNGKKGWKAKVKKYGMRKLKKMLGETKKKNV